MLQKETKKEPKFPEPIPLPYPHWPQGLARPNLKPSGLMLGPESTRKAAVGFGSRGAEFLRPSAGIKAASGSVQPKSGLVGGEGIEGEQPAHSPIGTPTLTPSALPFSAWSASLRPRALQSLPPGAGKRRDLGGGGRERPRESGLAAGGKVMCTHSRGARKEEGVGWSGESKESGTPGVGVTVGGRRRWGEGGGGGAGSGQRARELQTSWLRP